MALKAQFVDIMSDIKGFIPAAVNKVHVGNVWARIIMSWLTNILAVWST